MAKYEFNVEYKNVTGNIMEISKLSDVTIFKKAYMFPMFYNNLL